MPDLLEALRGRPPEGPFGVFDGNRTGGVEDFRFLLARLAPEDQSLVYRVREGALPSAVLLGEGRLHHLEHVDAGEPFEGRRYGFTLRTLALAALRCSAPPADPVKEEKAPPPSSPLPPAPPPPPGRPGGGAVLVPGLMLLLFAGLVVAAALVFYTNADRYVDENLVPRLAEKLRARQEQQDAALAARLAKLDELDGLRQGVTALRADLQGQNTALADSLRKQQDAALAPVQEGVNKLLKDAADLPATWDGKLKNSNDALAGEIEKRLGKPNLEPAFDKLEDELEQQLPDRKVMIESVVDRVRGKFGLNKRERRPAP